MGGERLGGALSDGFFVAPTVHADVDNTMRVAREEIFGPVISAIPFDSEDEVVAMANDTTYGLGSGLVRDGGFGHVLVPHARYPLDPGKRAAVLEAGASQVVHDNGDDLAARVLAACEPVAAAFDCVNRDSTARAALDTLAKGGKLVLVGMAGGDLTVSLAGMVFRSQSIMGNLKGSPADLHAVLALANEGKLEPTPVTCCPQDHANQALLDLQQGRFTGRAVLVQETAENHA